MPATVRTVMVGERRFRLPFIDLIPMSEDDNAALGESIRQAGRVKEPVVCWKEKKTSSEDTVIDGAHRVLWAAEHKLDRVPVRYESCDDEDEAIGECFDGNVQRRQLSEAQKERTRRERIQREAELRRQGESLRAIAEKEGVSPEQVRKDLRPPGVNRLTPGGKVRGRDGKIYADAPPLCDRCKRLGVPVKNCQACERVRKDSARKRAAKRKAKEEAKADAEQRADCFKTPVPAKLRDLLFDPWVQEAIDFLAATSEAVRAERVGERMAKKGPRNPFFDPKDFGDGYGFVIQYLDSLITHIKDNRLEAVCPACGGEKCPACKMAGLVPRRVYAELAGGQK